VLVRPVQEQSQALLATERELLPVHQQRGCDLARRHLHPAYRVAGSLAALDTVGADLEELDLFG
jgi:hypothetical protein